MDCPESDPKPELVTPIFGAVNCVWFVRLSRSQESTSEIFSCIEMRRRIRWKSQCVI